MKDRYSIAFILFFAGFILSLALFKFKNKIPAAALLIAGTLYLVYLYFQKARLHLNSSQLTSITVTAPTPASQVQIKTETGCKFTPVNQIGNNGIISNIDGVRIGHTGKRFKTVNGSDIYLDANNQFQPAGFGSALMQAIGNGGYEPAAIQNDECWN